MNPVVENDIVFKNWIQKERIKLLVYKILKFKQEMKNS